MRLTVSVLVLQDVRFGHILRHCGVRIIIIIYYYYYYYFYALGSKIIIIIINIKRLR